MYAVFNGQKFVILPEHALIFTIAIVKYLSSNSYYYFLHNKKNGYYFRNQ